MGLQNNWIFFTNLNYLETRMKKLISTLILLTLFPAAVLADGKTPINHSSKMDHSQHNAMTTVDSTIAIPVEAGHDGFAAIAEIVKKLSDNPNTDWSKVNITGLRNHLLDMDLLVSDATVEAQEVSGGMRFNVTGEANVLNAIQQMVPAHSIELSKIPEYTAVTESINNGVALTVTSPDGKIIKKIKGLGFFGLMATGSHHQVHHLRMAVGDGHNMNH